MKISNAHLRSFRNHYETAFEFGARVNVLLGENGQGKTNALEALSFLCLTKSFYASADATVMQQQQSFFEIKSVLVSDEGKEFVVRVAYDDNKKNKKFTINGAEVERFSTVIGMFPVVILSPENNSITFGSPVDRRKFIDLVISQSSKAYVEDSMEYRRIVRQRNAILTEAKGRETSSEIAPWNEMLIKYGSRIIFKRNKFLNEFAPYIARTYLDIVDERETPKIEYAPSISVNDDSTLEQIAEAMERKLAKKKNDEARFQTTLVGPHRDEMIFSLNGTSLKHFASQGQHKTFLVALKVAEFFYLKERCNETPVFLLDDVFSELDEHRSKKLLSVAESLGQIFITTTSEKVFGGAEWNQERRKFFIHNGTVVNEEQAA
ncbi:MAG: DNA replication/repair protein RecF [Bacteriovoracaceae bacterium]|nr:DNA replication/repair protein RecF [Bacteroidota bacterium]